MIIPVPGQRFFLSRQALGFLWLLKIQHAGLTHRFQVSIVACLFLIVGYVTYGLWALGPTYLSLTACRHVYEPWLQKRSTDGNLRRGTSLGTIKPISCVCISSYKTEGVFVLGEFFVIVFVRSPLLNSRRFVCA